MKILKTIGLVLLGLIALFLLLGLIKKKEFATSQTIVINAPQDLVFNTVNDLSTWESWSPWKEMDPEMKVTMGDKTVGVGASYSWVGPVSESGVMSITSSTPNSELKTRIEFGEQGGADADFTFAADGGNKTTTTWGFHTKIPFPFNAFIFGDFEGQINKDYARGLERLKARCEAQAKAPKSYRGFAVQPIAYPGGEFVIVRQEVPFANIQPFYAGNLGNIMQACVDKGLKMAGMPSGLYFSYDEEKGVTDMAAAIKVEKAEDLGGAMKAFSIPANSGLVIEHYGDYKNIANAHYAMSDYMADNKVRQNLNIPVIEEYVTDPGQEPDPSKWLTKLYYFIE